MTLIPNAILRAFEQVLSAINRRRPTSPDGRIFAMLKLLLRLDALEVGSETHIHVCVSLMEIVNDPLKSTLPHTDWGYVTQEARRLIQEPTLEYSHVFVLPSKDALDDAIEFLRGDYYHPDLSAQCADHISNIFKSHSDGKETLNTDHFRVSHLTREVYTEISKFLFEKLSEYLELPEHERMAATIVHVRLLLNMSLFAA